MFIEKTTYTEEEVKRINELDDMINRYLFAPFFDGENPPYPKDQTDAWIKERSDIYNNAINRYIREIATDYDRIIANVKEIVAAYTKEDYIEFIKPIRKICAAEIKRYTDLLPTAKTDAEREQIQKNIDEEKERRSLMFSYTYNSFRHNLEQFTGYEAIALVKGHHPKDEYDEILDKAAAAIYRPAKGKQAKPINLEAYNLAATTEQLSLFDRKFTPMLQGGGINAIMGITTKGLTPDPLRNNAAVIKSDRDGITIIDNYSGMIGEIGTSAKKILDTSIVQLTQINTYRGDPLTINPTVEIDLKEYARANGYKVDPTPAATVEEAQKDQARIQDTLKDLKKTLERDIDNISSITRKFTETKGKNKGDWELKRIISSGGVKRGVITINFDPQTARYLANSYITQFPTALLKHDNRNPNSYAIGRKLALHFSMDNNVLAGTNTTLAVATLLSAAPEIISYEELKAKGRRDWKRLIKEKLEKALDDNINVGYLSAWEYHDPKTDRRITKDAAAALTWEQYSRLMVDFAVIDAPDQSNRLQAKETAKLEAAKTEKKKSRKK